MLDPIHSSSCKHFWNFQTHLQAEERLSWDTDHDILGKLSSWNVSTPSVHVQSLCMWYHTHSTLNTVTPLVEDFFQTVFPESQTNRMERLPLPVRGFKWILQVFELIWFEIVYKFVNTAWHKFKRINKANFVKSKYIHRYLCIESLKLVSCLETRFLWNWETLLVFSSVLWSDLCFFNFLFAGFKALAIHHLKHWLSVFFMLMSSLLLARNFGRGTQELPFSGSYPTVWISSATIE